MPSRRRLRSIAALLAVAALVVGSGAHWVALQSVAWVGMVIEFAQDRPLGQAVSDALDGAHPCELCRAVASGQQTENGSDRAPAGAPATKLGKKLTALLEAPTGVARAGQGKELPRPEQAHGWVRLEAPPVPPPRLG